MEEIDSFFLDQKCTYEKVTKNLARPYPPWFGQNPKEQQLFFVTSCVSLYLDFSYCNTSVKSSMERRTISFHPLTKYFTDAEDLVLAEDRTTEADRELIMDGEFASLFYLLLSLLIIIIIVIIIIIKVVYGCGSPPHFSCVSRYSSVHQ